MKSYHISVNFDVIKTYRIRAKSDKEAAEILDKRVSKTLRYLDNPVIMVIEIDGKTSVDNEIIENQSVCEH